MLPKKIIYVKIGKKIGMRYVFFLSLGIWIITLFPFVLLSKDMMVIGMIVATSVGFGISGTLFFFDILMGDVIDQDELVHSVKRSASF